MKIPIKTLNVGLHEFDFTESAADLEIENLTTFQHPIFTKVWLEKGEDHLYIRIQVKTVAHFVCDRCLDEFEQEIAGKVQLYYSSKPLNSNRAEQSIEEEKKIRPLPADLKKIDLSKDARDTILLAVPMKLLCSESCKGLCHTCGVNLNHETCNCPQESLDPRWTGLKKLLRT